MPKEKKVEYTTVNVNESLLKFARKIAKEKQENFKRDYTDKGK